MRATRSQVRAGKQKLFEPESKTINDTAVDNRSAPNIQAMNQNVVASERPIGSQPPMDKANIASRHASEEDPRNVNIGQRKHVSPLNKSNHAASANSNLSLTASSDRIRSTSPNKQCRVTDEILELACKIDSARQRIMKRQSLIESARDRLLLKEERVKRMLQRHRDHNAALQRGESLQEVAKRWKPTDRHQRRRYVQWSAVSRWSAQLATKQAQDRTSLRWLQRVFADIMQGLLRSHLDKTEFKRQVEDSSDKLYVKSLGSERSFDENISGGEPVRAILPEDDGIPEPWESFDDNAIHPAPPADGAQDELRRVQQEYWAARSGVERARQTLAEFLYNKPLQRGFGESEEAFGRRYFETLRALTQMAQEASQIYLQAAERAEDLAAVPSDMLTSRFPEYISEHLKDRVEMEADASRHNTNFAHVMQWVEAEAEGRSLGKPRSLSNLESVAFGESSSAKADGKWLRRIRTNAANAAYDMRQMLERWPPTNIAQNRPPPLPLPDNVLVGLRRSSSGDDDDGETR